MIYDKYRGKDTGPQCVNTDVRDVPDVSVQPQHHGARFSLIAHSPKLCGDHGFSREYVNVCCRMMATAANCMLKVDMNGMSD
jgi:hypothetical protein